MTTCVRTVYLMCQGQQRRLPSIGGPKHLLSVGPERILERTLRLLGEMLPQWQYTTVIVGQRELMTAAGPGSGSVEHLELARPGICIVDGILAVLEVDTIPDRPTSAASPLPAPHRHGRTMVLLGDVVWSRAALAQLVVDPRPMVFAGTPDLTNAVGEVFGVAFDDPQAVWNLCTSCPCRVDGRRVRGFGQQQGGHLRRLLWHAQERMRLRSTKPGRQWHPDVFLPIDDWTDDIDTPVDMARLPELARLAELEERGVGAPSPAVAAR